ncbi:hypothetical protein [Isorropodon fossajaponicum symbiont]|uniref:hypothetical protein n=1 Tax=Isorropodon fossajaponicum symbiont TaxID=883811 RepID=UPI001CEDD1A9|nr:hypothetical protein [Isorropodon fossajaponicum symbiont]
MVLVERKIKKPQTQQQFTPQARRVEVFIEKFCQENSVVCLGGVAFGKGLLRNLTYALEENNFKENWTFFSDTYTDQLESMTC